MPLKFTKNLYLQIPCLGNCKVIKSVCKNFVGLSVNFFCMISLEEMKRKRFLHMQKIVCAAADFYHAIQIHSKGFNYLVLHKLDGKTNNLGHYDLSS